MKKLRDKPFSDATFGSPKSHGQRRSLMGPPPATDRYFCVDENDDQYVLVDKVEDRLMKKGRAYS